MAKGDGVDVYQRAARESRDSLAAAMRKILFVLLLLSVPCIGTVVQRYAILSRGARAASRRRDALCGRQSIILHVVQ